MNEKTQNDLSMTGMVVKSTGSWYIVRDEAGKLHRARLRGKFKLQNKATTNPLAVGDRVQFEAEIGGEDTVAIIHIEQRDNYILRKSVHKTAHGHIIAANIDQALLVASLVLPRTSFGFIDRFLVSAESFRIPTYIAFNKVDLLDAEDRAYLDDIMKMYESAGYKCLPTSTVTGENIDTLHEILHHKKTLLSGHSGVGKSSLINQIGNGLDLRTQEISTFANKGVHTTTFAEMFEFEPDSFVIDTPGIKELGIMDIENEELAHFFPEMRAMLGQCRFYNCTHVHEPNCAVSAAVKAGQISLTRYESYLSILSGDDNRK